jgi:hypothetical protein
MKKLNKKEAIDKFFKELKRKFPDVETEIYKNERIEIIAYTPEENDFEIAKEMADVTTKISLKGGPFIIVIPIHRKKAA